jgi:hypothetical protein
MVMVFPVKVLTKIWYTIRAETKREQAQNVRNDDHVEPAYHTTKEGDKSNQHSHPIYQPAVR